MKKPLWKISIATALEAEEAVTELLTETFNTPASSFFDFEKRTSRVTAYVSRTISRAEQEQVRNRLVTIKEYGLNIGAGKISVAKVRREDWAESWKRHFQPIEIGNKLLVKPDWSKRRPRKNQALVILNPGLSFGTGQHPTTHFCLREVTRFSPKARSFLDLGTGSGILAIAAARLGYRHIWAMDFDPEAIRVARANARVNRVKIPTDCKDVATLPLRPKQQFDVICANLISNLLVQECDRIVAQLSPQGVLVLAGILKTEFTEVAKTFEKKGLKLVSSRSKKEWKSGSFRFE